MARQPKNCNYVKVNGDICGAYRVNNSDYCYFHERTRRREQRRLQLGGPTDPNSNTGIKFDVIEDANSLLLANNEILYALMDKRIDSKRASLMLYSIQISASIMSQVDITSKDFGRYAAVVPDEEEVELKKPEQITVPETPHMAEDGGPRLLCTGDASL